MKKKNDAIPQGSVLSETYVPAKLPKYGLDLDGFITSGYSMVTNTALKDHYHACEDELNSLIESSDKFTVGEICDSYIDAQIEHLYCTHQAEVASHELQASHICASRETRKEVLSSRKVQLEETIAKLREKIKPLEDLQAQFELKIGRWHIPIGVPITILAMVVDALLNYSYLQGVLLQSAMLLIVCVLCMSVMSDGSMFCLGCLISRKEERFMNEWLYRVLVVGLFGLFVISVVAGVMIRFGSMDITYGTIDASGQFVGKESYSFAEWGVSLVTAFLTTCTGLISFAFSVDRNAHLVSRRRALEASLKSSETEYGAVNAELSALQLAVDPLILDQANRAAAEQNIESLRTGLKLHIRKLLAQKQADPSYTEAMAKSAENLLSSAKVHPLDLPTPYDGPVKLPAASDSNNLTAIW